MSGENLDVGFPHCYLCERFYCFTSMEQQKKINTKPCKGCKIRNAHCHATCKSYADSLIALAEKKKKLYDEAIINDYIRLAHKRVKKRRR